MKKSEHLRSKQPSEIKESLFIAQNIDKSSLPEQFRCFQLIHNIKYRALRNDFGPMNLSSIVVFIQSLDDELKNFPEKQIVLCVSKGKRNLTNAVFLLGSYMLLKQNMSSRALAASFGRLDTNRLEAYRDATCSRPDFGLCLLDCWQGLENGNRNGWFRYSGNAVFWGMINTSQYRHYEDPANGDLQEVVPGKFVAFKGPVDLGGLEYLDTASGLRLFSPAYYADALRDLGVRTIIRLNEPRYDAKAFTSRGFQHFDLPLDDCTAPPDDVVAAFFRIVDSAPGAVAVHCHAGLGRTGTLLALYLMRSHGFTAREAMGWLRIMRPGSVIGEQQHYLCSAERVLSARPVTFRRPDSAARFERARPGAGDGVALPSREAPSQPDAQPDRHQALVTTAAAAAAASARARRGRLLSCLLARREEASLVDDIL